MVVIPWQSSLSVPVHSWCASSRASGLDLEERWNPPPMLLDKGNDGGVRLGPAEDPSRRNRTSGRRVVRQPAVMPRPASTLDQMEI